MLCSAWQPGTARGEEFHSMASGEDFCPALDLLLVGLDLLGSVPSALHPSTSHSTEEGTVSPLNILSTF